MNKKIIMAVFLLGSIGIANTFSMHNCSTRSHMEIMFEGAAQRKEFLDKHPGWKADLEEAERKYKQTPESILAQSFMHSYKEGDMAEEGNRLFSLRTQCWNDYTSRTFSRFFPQPLVCQEYAAMDKSYDKLCKEMDKALDDERKTDAYKEYKWISDHIDYLSRTTRY